ncbi:hypothetical protein ACIQD3_02230 [Peribacillus loiseleuriae]|uniref:hypothetical protein n=1 Tax=Peribacillus loiseleuriae TaxID=1679170 RepID=UPI003822B870
MRVKSLFFEKYEQDPKRATDYFYQVSKNSHYIQSKRIEKNIHFSVETVYGKHFHGLNLSCLLYALYLFADNLYLRQ